VTADERFARLKTLYSELLNPFPCQDPEQMAVDFAEHFSSLPEECCLNADFNSWCGIIAGTAGYVLAGKFEQIPQVQIARLKSSFF
jgi:hypothetical protein